MAKTKILVVEDNGIMAEHLQRILKRMGYDVPVTADSGPRALKEAEKHMPDLVLMDIKLKGDMDGIETAEVLRRRFNIPIIFTTAYVDDKLLKRAKVTEPYGYIIKPVDEKILKANIEISLYRAKIENEMKETNEFLQNILNSSSHVSIIATDLKRNILYWNTGAENILGYKAEEMVNRKKIDVLYLDEDSKKEIKEIRAGVINNKKSVNCDIREKAKDGRIVWVNMTLTPRVDEKGCVVGILGIGQDITERKKVDEKLKESEERFRIASQIASDVVYERDLQTGIATFYGDIDSPLGYKPDGYPRTMEGWRKHVHPEDLAWIDRQNIDQLKPGVPYTIEYRMRKKDGTYMTWLDRIMVIRDEKTDKPLKFVGAATDITERKNAEELLRTSEAQLANAMQIARLGRWEYDVASDLFTFNDHFYAIFRTTADKVGGYTMSPARYTELFLYPDDKVVVGIEMKKAFEATDPHFSRQLEHRIIYSDGNIGWISVRFFIVKDEHGRTVKTYGVNQDITERKKAEDKIRESEEKYRSIVENSTDQIFMLDKDFKFLSINKVAADISRKSPQEMLGMSIFEVFPETTAAQFSKNIKNVFETGKSMVIEEKMIIKDRELYSSSNLNPVKDENGKVTAVTGIVRDITASKQAEEELKKNYEIENIINYLLKIQMEGFSLQNILEETLKKILSVKWLALENKGAIFLTSDDGERLIMKVQSGLSKFVCGRCKEVKFGECMCGRVALFNKVEFASCLDEKYTVKFEGLQEYKHGNYCVPITSNDKTLGVINTYLKQGHIRNKKEEGFLSAVSDILAGIIERKKTEQEKENLHLQLLKSTRLASVGQLAGGIAHEINNPMGVILGFAQSIVKRVKEDEPLYMPLKSIEREAIRCKKLVEDLLIFSRTEKTYAEKMDINNSIDGAVSLVEAQAKVKNVVLIKEYGADLPHITVNKSQIQQVIVNLCNNALDAMSGESAGAAQTMPEGKKITIKTRCHAERSEASRDSSLPACRQAGAQNDKNAFVEIKISDTGTGMTEEVKKHLFEPFYTTKEVGKGTGLGLSLCYEIIQKHNGTIEVESEVGKGTTFIIKLPGVI